VKIVLAGFISSPFRFNLSDAHPPLPLPPSPPTLRTSHGISIHAPISAEPWDVPGAVRAFAVGGTPADCALVATRVLFRNVPFALVLSGINRGDNAGLHVVYSGTLAGAREGAMRGGGDAIDGGEEGGAVGIAISLASYKRDADYAFAARFAADLALAAVARVPGFIDAMRGNVLNVNVPAIPAGAIKGVKRTVPGKSCTQPDWIRVPPPAAADADYTSEGGKKSSTTLARVDDDASDRAADDDAASGGWIKGKRWFRNMPGAAACDRTEGTDWRAVDDGYVSVSALGSGFETIGDEGARAYSIARRGRDEARAEALGDLLEEAWRASAGGAGGAGCRDARGGSG